MSFYRGYFGVRGMDPDGTMLTANSGDSILIAEGPGPGSVRRQIFKDQAGNCYQTYGYMLRTSIECPSPKSVFIFNPEDQAELLDPHTKTGRGLGYARRHGGFFFNWEVPLNLNNPHNTIKQINDNLCEEVNFSCLAVLTVLAHGSHNDTFSGKVTYDMIQDFYGTLFFCRPCYILLNSCSTGASKAKTSNRIEYAAKVAQTTGCTVIAPEYCLVGFFGDDVYTSKYRDKTILGRGAAGCFKIFDPGGKCRYRPDYRPQSN